MSRPTEAISALYLITILVLASGLLCSAGYVQCPLGDYPRQLMERPQLIIRKTEVYEDNRKCFDASSWVVGEKNGTLGVYFNLISDPEEVKILILEKWISKEWRAYATVKLLLEDLIGGNNPKPLANTPVCSSCGSNKYGYHTFEYISSGKYRLHSCTSSSFERDIHTAFNESKLNCTSTHTVQTLECSRDDGTCRVKIDFQQHLTQKSARLYILKYSNNTEVLSWSVRARVHENDLLDCQTDDLRVLFSRQPDIAIHGQKFVIDKLLPGLYKVEVTSYGQLSSALTILSVCNIPRSVPINVTRWDPSPERNNHQKKIPPPSENVVVIFLIVLAALVSSSSCCYVIYLIRKHVPYPGSSRGSVGILVPVLTREKVLLLYARDCPLFNSVMTTIRDILRKNNFEVYDCYDPAQSHLVDKGPTLWMRCLVEDSSVRVVVVSSKCARLQQLALMNGGSVSYKQPHYLDKLFLYGLCDTMTIHKNIYQKIFNVSLAGFTENEDMLSILNDSRIYSLPTHLLELFRDLRYNANCPEETEELKSQVATLKENMDLLIGYKNAEKDYVRHTILHKKLSVSSVPQTTAEGAASPGL